MGEQFYTGFNWIRRDRGNIFASKQVKELPNPSFLCRGIITSETTVVVCN